MSTPELPSHIGGYQHLAPDTPMMEGDIYVFDGKPNQFIHASAFGKPVSEFEGLGYHIYRKIPCPQQGGDRTLTEDEKENLRRIQERLQSIPHDQKPGVIVARALGCDALPKDAKARKGVPIYSGFLRYFPRAVAAVARLSQVGNDQHNPGKPLHWDRSKSGDEHDALMRHLMEAGTVDTDGVRHSTKAAWRAMAALEKELEAASE